MLGLDLVHEGTNVIGYGIHAQRIESAVEHVGLDAYLVERLAEGTHSIVGVFACQEVYLLKGTTVGLYTREATHFNDDGSDALQLVLARLELSRRLPHVTINETELYFLFHLTVM